MIIPLSFSLTSTLPPHYRLASRFICLRAGSQVGAWAKGLKNEHCICRCLGVL